MWSYSVRRGEGKPQSCCNFWNWWKQRSTVAETQDSNQWVWGVMKEIYWTQERRISWNWWCSLHVFSGETQDRTVCELWSTSRGGKKKATFFNIPQSCFKASKGWAIRFMCQMGLALWRRMTICQKLPKDFEQKLLNYQWYIANLRKTGNFLMGQIAKIAK